MDNGETNQEWFESQDQEIEYNEINRSSTIPRYANPANNNIEYSDLNASKSFKTFKNEIIKVANYELSQTSAESDYNPLDMFDKIKREIDLIEKDINFYLENKDAFKDKKSVDKAFNEIKNLKVVCNFITESSNFKVLEEIKNKNIKINQENLSLLNKHIYDKLNEHVLNKLRIINRLKVENINDFQNVEYELYLTPDTTKVKLYTKLIEIKKFLSNIESRIGDWDIKTKKQSISDVVESVKNRLRLFDKEYQTEIHDKLDALTTRLNELNEGKEEFYQTINKSKIDDLLKVFNSSKEIEDLIYKSISKMESLKNNHEESAYIFVKLKEILDQQDKIESIMSDNEDCLYNLKRNISDNKSCIRKNLNFIKERLNKLKK